MLIKAAKLANSKQWHHVQKQGRETRGERGVESGEWGVESGDCPNFRVSENGTVPFEASTVHLSTKFGTDPEWGVRSDEGLYSSRSA